MKRLGAALALVLLGIAISGTAVLVVLGHLPEIRRHLSPAPFRVVTILEDRRWAPRRGGPTALVAGDFDGDGRDDVLAIGGPVGRGPTSRSPFFLLRAHASKVVSVPAENLGSLEARVPPGTRIRSVATGDLDGDGRTDLVVSYATATAVFLGGTGPHHDGFRFTGFVGGPKAPLANASVVVADLDKGQPADIASFDPTTRTVRVWRLGPKGGYTPTTVLATRIHGRIQGAIAAGDIDGDGRIDLAAAAGTYARAEAVVLHNTGGGHFVPWGELPLAGPLPSGANLRGPTLFIAPVFGRRPDLLCLTQLFGRLNARGATFLNLFANPGAFPPGRPAFDGRARRLDVQPVAGVDAGLTLGDLGRGPRKAVVGFDSDRLWTYDFGRRPFVYDNRDDQAFNGAFRAAVIADLDGPGRGRLVVLAVGRRIHHRRVGAYLLVFHRGILADP